MDGQWTRVGRWLDQALDTLCVLACVALVGVSFAAVIFRYVLNDSLVWSEELARYLFIWIVFLGGAIGVRERSHIAVDVLRVRPGSRSRLALERLAQAATLAFAALLVVPGWRFVQVGMSNYSPALEIPMGLVYLAPVVGGGLIVVYLFRAAARSGSEAGPTC